MNRATSLPLERSAQSSVIWNASAALGPASIPTPPLPEVVGPSSSLPTRAGGGVGPQHETVQVAGCAPTPSMAEMIRIAKSELKELKRAVSERKTSGVAVV